MGLGRCKRVVGVEGVLDVLYNTSVVDARDICVQV